MKPRDLALLRVPSDVTLTADGSIVVVAVTRIDLDADAYRSELWAGPTDGSDPLRRLTNGPRDTAPRCSPDGRCVAFLRAGDDTPAQLHVLPLDAGEARALTAAPLGVTQFAWAPDSRRLAFVARVPEEGRYRDDVPADKEPPRRITTLKYRRDGIGFLVDRPAHVFVVEAHDDEPAAVRVTSGDADHADVTWSQAGDLLAFAAARHATRDLDLAVDVFVQPPEPADARRLTRSDLAAGQPVFARDDATIVFRAPTGLDVAGRVTGLWTVPGDGSRPPRLLTDPEADDVFNLLGPGHTGPIVDGEDVLTTRLARGAVELVSFPLSGGSRTPLLDGPGQVQAFDAAAGVVAAAMSSDTSAGEVVVLAGGEQRVLSDFGAALARGASLRPMTELHGCADDGYPVHGWVVKPAGSGPFPVLLSVHGGPLSQYGWTLLDEAQVYAGAGYAVVLGNPRGSAGYGQAHGRAIIGALGDRDAADVLALLDAALADPELDGERVGVMGGSYGGWMAAWLLATTDRFRAGIVERAVTSWDSFAGSSDIGSWFPAGYCGSHDPEVLRAQSPLTRAAAITVPTLVIHAEQDWRCPLEQAQRLYALLRRRGVETELLLFPGEGHELSRSGLPSHRLQRFEAVLAWWSRHL